MTAPTNDARRLWAFALCGATQAIIYGLLAFSSRDDAPPGLFVLLSLLAFIVYLSGLLAARPLAGRTALVIALVSGLLFRLLLLPEPPLLSDDYFRYLWDGLLQTRGINPYRYAPADPALTGLADSLQAQVNHAEVRTIYPPLAQLVFLFAAATGGGWLTLKAIWLACDVAIAGLLYQLLPAKPRISAWALYWWSPLVVIEVAWNAHLDLLGVLLVVATLYSARRTTRPASALGVTLGGATLVKYFAVALLPSMVRGRRPWRLIIAFVLTVLALYLPYISAGRHLFAGLTTYAAHWRFNDGLFWLLATLTTSTVLAKLLAAFVVLFIIFQSARNEWPLERAAFWLIGAILVLSPTVHPWYLLWMVPLIALRPNRAWLYLSGSVFLAYYGLGDYWATGVWPEPCWIKLAIYGPFFVLLVFDAWRGSWWQAYWEQLMSGRG